MSERTYTVTGMTCDHCALSVSEEVEELTGVERAEVDLTSRRLTVAGEDFTDADVQAAVSEAGYAVAP